MAEIAAELSTKSLEILPTFLLILYASVEMPYELTVMLAMTVKISSEFSEIS